MLPALGSEHLQSITPARLNRLYAELLERGRKNGPGGLAPKTVRYVHGILRKALADAVRWNLVQRNAADFADPPKVGAAGREMQTWSAEELRAFLEHIAGERLYAAYLLAVTTGRRRAELLGLRWRDVDLDAARLSVRQSIVSVAYDLKFAAVPLPDQPLTVLWQSMVVDTSPEPLTGIERCISGRSSLVPSSALPNRLRFGSTSSRSLSWTRPLRASGSGP